MGVPRKTKHKHKQRRSRRAKYNRMLDGELEQEKAFQDRVVRSIDNNGMDVAHDGRPIKANFWGYMESRRTRKHAARACLHHVEQAIRSIQPSA